MKPLLVASTPAPTRGLALGRRATDVEAWLRPALPTRDDLDPQRPVVVLLDRCFLAGVPDPVGRLHELAQVAALAWCAAPGEPTVPPDIPAGLLTTIVPADASIALKSALLAGAMRHARSLRAERLARRDTDERRRELLELAQVGAALGTERELLSLLELVLDQARRLTGSDAGSLYLVEEAEEADDAPEAAGASPRRARSLRFKLSQNHSLPELRLGEFTLPVDNGSLAGHAAATDSVVEVADVYLMPAEETFRPNRSFDERFGYRTRSVLVVPLRTHARGVVGVLQLINRKRRPAAVLQTLEDVEREVLPFDRRSVELVTALAAQAAVAIDNSRLYESIERLFEGFVTASVTAIESRDPTTSGHSARVATLTVRLAEALDAHGSGPYAGIHFSRDQLRELRYASLLHDFGKFAVREEVLVKGKKLYPVELERIRARLQRLMQEAELEYERGRAEHLLQRGRDGYDAAIAAMVVERDTRLAHLRLLLRRVEEANEPTLLPEVRVDELERLCATPFCDARGRQIPLLRPEELASLRIRQGTLAERERREIEAHVTHTRRFLSQIPWTPELRGIPAIACGHHEKLDGSGYPLGLAAGDLPVQVRMLTITDIYDALTATDRPYKRAVSPERAFEIMREEVRSGQLDGALLETFIAANVWRLTTR